MYINNTAMPNLARRVGDSNARTLPQQRGVTPRRAATTALHSREFGAPDRYSSLSTYLSTQSGLWMAAHPGGTRRA